MRPLRRIAISLVPALLLAGSAGAQSPVTFTIDQGNSNWTWSGTTSIGPLQGNPSNAFQLQGTAEVRLGNNGPSPISTARVLSSDALVVPDLSGLVPNPIQVLPPLAIIDVQNLRLSLSTSNFNVAPNGNFTTNMNVVILSGTVIVTPLIGNQTMTDLTGTMGTPTMVNGNLSQSGNSVHASIPQTAQFMFVDANSGISATIDIMGDLEADYDCPAPVNYCSATTNSTGGPAAISTSGSFRIQDNNLTLDATSLPPNQFGYFLMADSQDFVTNFGGSQGNLCLGSPIVRLVQQIQNSGPNGEMHVTLDLGNLPQSTTVGIGEAWNFQGWFRDQNPNLTSNTTNGVTVVFCP